MRNGRTLLMLAGLGLAALWVLPPAEGEQGSGAAVICSPNPCATSGQTTLGVVDVYGAKGPCTPKYIGAMDVGVLAQNGVHTPDELAVTMDVMGKPVMLHNLVVLLYSNNQVVWQSDAQCVGCLQTYPVSDPQGAGYVFRLDSTAVALAMQQWPQATAVGLAGVGHDGDKVRFGFARVDPAPLKKGK